MLGQHDADSDRPGWHKRLRMYMVEETKREVPPKNVA